MRYSHSKFRVELPVIAMRKKFIHAATRHDEESMTKRRFVATFITLLLCLFLVYASFFYIPGYVDINKLIGLSTQNEKLPQRVAAPRTFDRYKNMFKVRRGYLSEGQNLILEYSLTEGTVINASIGRCNAPIIVEVFYCQRIDEQLFNVRSATSGTEKFVIKKPGFYYFDESVTHRDGSETKQPYIIKWSRGKRVTEKQVIAQNEKWPRLELRRSPQ